MKIHHLQTASFCPFGGPLLHDRGLSGGAAHLLCHSLLIETEQGLVLVDTGFGIDDLREPKQRMPAPFVAMMNVKLDEKLTALRQIEALGFKASDVRHIVPTHLDLDHAGGMPDFPKAKVHIYEDEYLAATDPQTLNEKQRYRQVHWRHNPDWQRYTLEGESWFGFPAVRPLLDAGGDDVLIIPVTGHTRGHTAIAVKSEQGWLLHCGDAYFHQGQMDLDHEHCPIGLEIFQRLIAVDNEARVENLARLRQLKREHSHEVDLFSAHDRDEFERLAAHPAVI
jgi:glyoxylase-like metal-dependent hydrolase (beta-lactamase superfamily II)